MLQLPKEAKWKPTIFNWNIFQKKKRKNKNVEMVLAGCLVTTKEKRLSEVRINVHSYWRKILDLKREVETGVDVYSRRAASGNFLL